MKSFFYESRHGLTRESAEVVLQLILNKIHKFESVVDIGCGVGTWLQVAKHLGAKRVVGYEAPGNEQLEHLVIDARDLKTVDLLSAWDPEESYDLAICMEVAEHLDGKSGRRLVRNLTHLAPVVLFSAAIPGQGGHGHINEQWPEYWQTEFNTHNFFLCDLVRPSIIRNIQIPYWYRQNTFVALSSVFFSDWSEKVLTKSTDMPLLPIRLESPSAGDLDSDFIGIRQALTNLRREITRKFVKILQNKS